MLGIFRKKEVESLISKSTYYERECVLNNVADLFLILSERHKFNFHKTQKEILVNDVPLNNIRKKDVIKKMGVPKYTFDNTENIKAHKVLFYKEEVDIYRFLLQFHLIDDRLFFVANKLYTGLALSNSNKVLVIKQLADKYLVADKYLEISNDFSFNIVDPKNNCLLTKDTVFFYVYYFSGDPISEQLINEYSFIKEELEKEKEDTFKKSLEIFL